MEDSVEDLWRTRGLVPKVEKAEELFVAEMQRRHGGASICITKPAGQQAEGTKYEAGR